MSMATRTDTQSVARHVAKIAAEPQRLINETYSAFVQGLHANAGAAGGRHTRGADGREYEDSSHLLAPAMDP